MLAYADSVSEVVKALEEDIYATTGIWDLEKVQIMPVCGPRDSCPEKVYEVEDRKKGDRVGWLDRWMADELLVPDCVHKS